MIQNEKISGFTLEKVECVEDYKSIGYLFRHDKTGFELYYLKNDDKECFFSYDVYTPAENDTGVFHILEHTLLTGSKKYPVRDPFMSMVRNSCNTFLNAMTGPDRTYYPAASPVKKDFDNIFKVYTDAVFDPLLRKESFMQEGIRLSSEGGIHFEGVVFSEMLGDISSHESVVSSASSRPLFEKGTPYTFESGGYPPSITDLSYEKFIETYNKYYAPRNIKLFLYGDLDITEKLEYLDREYLSKRGDGGKKIERIKQSPSWSKARKFRTTSNASSDELSSTVMVSWLFGSCTEPEENTELSILTDLLLGNPGCPLYKAIVDSGLGRDLSPESGMSDSFRDLVFSVGIDGVKDESKAEEIESFILNALERIADEGFDGKAIEASIRKSEFRLQEIPSGSPQGYRLFFSRIDKGWIFDKTPGQMLQIKSELKSIRNKLEKDPDYFSKLIQRWFLNNRHRLLSVITMDKENKNRLEKEIEDKLSEHKDEYKKETEDSFIRFSHSDDKADDIRKLPKLNLSDLPNLNVSTEHEKQQNLVTMETRSNGVVYADMAFDVTNLKWNELEDLSLLSRLLLMTNVSSYSYSDFLTELNFVTGGASISIESGTDYKTKKDKTILLVRFKALNEYFKDALSLFELLIKEADITNKERIKATITDIESDYAAYCVRIAHQYALLASSSRINDSALTTERTTGLSFWLRLKEMENELDTLPDRLMAIKNKVFTQNRLLFHVATDKELIDDVALLSSGFILSLPEGESLGENTREYIKTKENLAFLLGSNVSYLGLSSQFSGTKEDEAKERMFLSIYSNNLLWSLIREKGGAYGAGSTLDPIESLISFYTYRDPRLDKSVSDIKKGIAEEEFDIDMLNDAKLRVLSRDIRPNGPMQLALVDLRRMVYSLSDEERMRMKNEMLKVTLNDLESVRGAVLKEAENAVIAVLADERAVSESSIPFKKINLPLN